MISGAFGGALWGSVFGAVSAWGILLLSDMEPLQTAITDNTWAVVALLSILIGAFFGAVLGLFIGVGISQEDSYLYEDSVEHGHVLMMVQASDRRATEASQIMHQINAASRAQPRNVPS